MTADQNPLRIAAAALFLLAGPIGIALGVGDELPARVGCDCTAAEVDSDWANYGTATSAPLGALIAIVVGFFLTFTSGWRQAVGVAILTVMAAAVFAASLGEPYVPGEADTPHFLVAIIRTTTYLAAAAVVLLGLRDLASRWRARSQPQEGGS